MTCTLVRVTICFVSRFERAFFERDALDVARDVLGAYLRCGGVTLRITEVEAYRWPNDTASHANKGQTQRNMPMFGEPAHAYVYLCYGIHHLLNIVTNPVGEGAAVLIRACEPVDGIEIIKARRKIERESPELLIGPGRLTQALGVTTKLSGHDLLSGEVLELVPGVQPKRIVFGPRVGIDYASEEHKRAPWRLADANSAWVSHRAKFISRVEKVS